MRICRLALFLFAAGCAGLASPPAEPSVLVFEPRLAHGNPAPFPVDAAAPGGKITPHDDLVARGARAVEGFAPWSPIVLRFRGPALDVSALPRAFRNDATAPVVVHVSPAAAPPPAAAELLDAAALAPYRALYDGATQTLVLLLKTGVGERMRVTVLVRSSLRNEQGGRVELDPGFAAYMRARPWLPAPEDALAVFSYETAPVQTIYRAFAAAAAPLGRVEAGAFEVFSPAGLPSGAPVTALAERLPDFGWGLEPGSADLRFTGVGAVVYGRVRLGSVRAEDGTLALASATAATAAGEEVEFLVAVPDAGAVEPAARARLGTPPRYPVVVFGHGYTACKETLLALAPAFASQGLALAGIDAVGHGARAGEGEGQCGLRLPADFGTDPGAIETGYADTIQQTRQFVALLPEIAARIDRSPADGTPDLSTGAVGYAGQSMGAINGPAVVSLAPEITAAVFNVGMGGLAAAMFSRGSAAEKTPGEAFFPFADLGIVTSFTLADQLYEPLHFTAGLAGKSVLVQQAEFDELVPALGTEWFAAAVGAVSEAGAPRPVPGAPAAAFPIAGKGAYRSVFAEADHIFFVRAPGAAPGAALAAQRQAAGFLSSALAGAPEAPASR